MSMHATAYGFEPAFALAEIEAEPLARLDVSRLTRARVVIADDHPLFREGLVRAISANLSLEVVGEAADGVDALTLIEEMQPDVALLDVRMPRLDGIDVCESVARRVPPMPTRVVLLSAYMEPSLLWRAAVAGASGYMSKESSRTDICDALVDVALGGTAFAPDAEDGLLEALEQILAIDSPGPAQASDA
jgi:two-component system nitrate/nitrite response regulator NarL